MEADNIQAKRAALRKSERAIKIEYGRFLCSASKLMEEKKVKLADVKVTWSGYDSEMSCEACEAKDISSFLMAIRRSQGPYTYENIADLLKLLCNDEGEKLVAEYDEKLKRKLSERVQPVSQTGKKFKVKIDKELSREGIVDFRITLATLFKCKTEEFILEDIHEGCIELIYVIPSDIAEKIQKCVVSKEEEDFSRENILELWIESEIIWKSFQQREASAESKGETESKGEASKEGETWKLEAGAKFHPISLGRNMGSAHSATAMLPQLHKISDVPSSRIPGSSPPPNSPPEVSLGGVAIPPIRDEGFVEAGIMQGEGTGNVSPPVCSSVPVTSARFPTLSKQTTQSESLDSDQLLQPSDTSTLRRDHYVALKTATKCSDENCHRRFKWADRKRNCRMCGEVFCWKCTKLMRKLSTNAEPDSLGTFHNVCEKCYNANPRLGPYRDLKYEFDQFRLEARKRMEFPAKAAADGTTLLTIQQSSKCKTDQVRVELDRLVKGYENENALRGFVGTQDWQKSAHWVPDAKAAECFLCERKFHLTMRKINCHVCGQVFCHECTKSEVLLYCQTKTSHAEWAINGKEGGLTSQPYRFETYPICNGCCSEMEEILLADINETLTQEQQNDPFHSNAMEEIAALQSELSTLQKNVEKNLPIYQCLVNTLGIEELSPHSIKGDHPLRELVKVQSDLSDTFTHLANRSQALKNISAGTATQKRLLEYIMMGMFVFYQEYMFLFKSAQIKFREMIPIETLCVTQEYLDKLSMEQVHLTLRQLMYELLNIEKTHQCKLDYIQHLSLADEAIENDLQPLIQKAGENWDEHLACVKKFILDGFKNKPMIQLQRDPPNNGANYQIYVQYFTLGRTTSLISQCVRELEAKTKEEAFLQTKSSLAKAGKHVLTELKAITDKLTQTP